MQLLGIDPHDGQVFEGNTSKQGRLVFPTPILIPIVFGENAGSPEKTLHMAVDLFREDIFDPVTKLRRGRIYSCRHQGGQPQDWTVVDPYNPLKQRLHALSGGESARLHTYAFDPLVALRSKAHTGDWPPVLLGEPPFSTFWRIVGIECAAVGGPIVTIRPVQSFEDLPQVHSRAIPTDARIAARHAWNEVAACIHVGNPSDRIDRCRNLLTIVFAYSAKRPDLDLGQAVNAWSELDEKNKKSIAAHCGQIVARLHSKTKHSEQVSRALTPATDADSQLALRCTAFVLTYFGWAK